MPISYHCPHCGKQFSVAEQYAGQSGPCAACGQTITIPGGMPPQQGYPPQGYAPRASSGSGTPVAIIVTLVVLLLLCPGVLIALLLPAVQAAREAARRSSSQNNLKQIGIALHNYHDTYNTFPPAVVYDDTGKPLYSGFVLLLPFMEQAPLANQWNPSKAWDDPSNMALSQIRIPTLIDPSSPSGMSSQSNYVFVTGKGALFEKGVPMGIANITDGTSNTLAVVETKANGASWAAPQEIDITVLSGGLPPGNHPGGNLVLMADGSVRFVSKSVAPQTLQSLSTRAGGEPVSGF